MNPHYYRQLLSQPQRLAAMRAAIEASVRSGDVVVEVGTGLGTYAIWAARAGASRVYAIEPARVADVAARVLAASGEGETIRLLRGRVEEVELPERADVLITEDFTPWFFDQHLHDILLYVRERVLAEGGRVIPGRVVLQAAPWGGPPPPEEDSSETSLWKHRAGSEGADLHDVEGIDFTALHELVRNMPDAAGIPEGGLLAPACDLFDWDLARVRPGVHHARGEWEVEREGSVWGIGVWALLHLSPGISYSNAPGAGEMSWGQGHFPVDPPLEVGKGTRLLGDMEARSDPNGRVWWRWRLEAAGSAAPAREGNTFRALPIDEGRVSALSAHGRIPLSRWAAVDAFLLTALEEHPLEEAARLAVDAFPGLLRDEGMARRRAARIREPYVVTGHPENPGGAA